MKIGIIGSGIVGQTLGAKWVELGQEVVLGTRDPGKLDEKKGMAGTLREWLAATQGKGRVATFREAAAAGELLVNATHGQVSLAALTVAEAGKVGAKILVDAANELDFSGGMPPKALASHDRCLAEAIQAAFPNLRVVKAFNMIAASIMVNPKALAGGEHSFFLCGNDADAKATVTSLLRDFGWNDIVDLGDLGAARGMEMYLGLWIRLWGALQTPMLNIKLVR
jgi:8-hydroxy-5-deazaflavin:NADPH oxidoreductase